MGINIKGTSVNTSQPAPQSSTPTSFNFGLMSRKNLFGTGGEIYENLFKKLQNEVKIMNESGKSDGKYHILKLLKDTVGLNYNAIVIAHSTADITTAHILMIEKTGEYPTPVDYNIGNTKYEIVRTPADALDKKYIDSTQQLVADNLGVNYNEIVVVDGTLVPNEFDVNNEGLVCDLLVNTINSIDSEIYIQTKNYRGINLVDIMNNYRNGKFFVNLFFNNAENVIHDQTGMPVRQDICISLSYKLNSQQNNKSVNQGTDSQELVKVFGYIDFEWTNPIVMNGMISTQKFIPNFIITHIESSMIPTPDILILAIVSVLSVNEDMTWLQAFKPSPIKKGEIDYSDIGALNIEGNIENSNTGYGQKVKTKVKEFTIVEFNKLAQMLVRPNLMVSIDLPKAGPDTWMTSAFYHAKFNRSQGAAKRIFDSLNALSNGVTINNNIPIFADITNKIHGGYYKTKDGIFDIRILSSYLGVANYIAETNQQPLLITQYTNTLYNETIPPELRAAERKKFIDNMSNGTAVYKQFYDRVTFTSDFLLTAINTLKSINFAPIFNNVGVSNDIFQRRSTTNFGNALLGQDVRVLGSNNMYNNFYMPFNYNRNF